MTDDAVQRLLLTALGQVLIAGGTLPRSGGLRFQTAELDDDGNLEIGITDGTTSKTFIVLLLERTVSAYRDLSPSEVRDEVLAFYNTRVGQQVYESEAAEQLNLHPLQVHNAVYELHEQGLIQPAKEIVTATTEARSTPDGSRS